MFTVRGHYEDGIVKLDKNLPITKNVDVIVTFLENEPCSTDVKNKNFSFSKSKEILACLKDNLSKEIIEERSKEI